MEKVVFEAMIWGIGITLRRAVACVSMPDSEASLLMGWSGRDCAIISAFIRQHFFARFCPHYRK